jgi:Flp pilus assembly protein TadG
MDFWGSKMIKSIHNRRRNKGSLMLEFVLLLPFALFLITFSVDMGRVVMVATGLHDSVSVAARAGARQGTIGTTRSIPSNACSNAVYLPQDTVYNAFCQSVNAMPGFTAASFTIITPTSTNCERDINPKSSRMFVTVRASAKVDYITPGLGALIGIVTGQGMEITQTGVARCEVAY